jgi:tripartite-type tricarboxylate transporter receptor subunit TctC
MMWPRSIAITTGRMRGAIACIFAAALAAAIGSSFAARADSVADFYKGKTIYIIIGTSPGNDYDFRGRLLARYLGEHVPGHPNVVPLNMPGAGGIQAANYMANVAPRDGTYLHMIMSNMMSAQAMGTQSIRFDTRQLPFIGNTSSAPNVMVTWYTTKVTSIEDATRRTVLMGAPMGTEGVIYAELMNALIGTRFKIITGYPGGNEVNLAMEQGEVDGRASNSWASWKANQPQWLASKKINILMQVGLTRYPELPNVPLMLELAKNDRDRKVMAFLSADTAISRSLVTTPGTPPDRVEALRRAFDAVMIDPHFLAEAATAKMDITPVSGIEAQKVADSIVNTPKDVVDRAKAILGNLVP